MLIIRSVIEKYSGRDAGGIQSNSGELCSEEFVPLRVRRSSQTPIFSFDAPASHLLKISDLLPSSKSVNPINSKYDYNKSNLHRLQHFRVSIPECLPHYALLEILN